LGKNTDREKSNLQLVAWVSLTLLGTSKVDRNKELGRKKTRKYGEVELRPHSARLFKVKKMY